ncbi:hypothetical protein F5Y12DRAFT_79496 [Xylaria sp. FL1777]|nr:hypothetical protein F5Y12DRAFT_79496 [Xylaria sp. FL1777]
MAQNSLLNISQSLPSNIHHVELSANAPHQGSGIQQTIQCESLPEIKKSPTKPNFITNPKTCKKLRSLSWPRTEALSTVPVPLANLASELTEVANFTEPVDSINSSSSLPSNESTSSENSDNKANFSEVGHTPLQHGQTTASNSGSPSLPSAAASNIPAPIYNDNGGELVACGVASRDTQLSPEPPIEVSHSSTDSTPLTQQTFPIRTKLGSSDSKKYKLRSCSDKAGLYYSSTIWPEEPQCGRDRFLVVRLQRDLNNHIQKASQEKKNKRLMKKHHIALTGQAFAIESRLSGNISANEEDLELLPTIWVICASGLYKTLVKEALRQPHLSWLDKPIEVVEGLTFNKRRERVGNLDLSGGICFANSHRLHLHIEEAGKSNSACGLVTCATITKDGRIIDQCISRVGGLLLLDHEVICATSTAHGILDMLVSAGICCIREEDVSDSRDISDPDTDVGTDSEGDGESMISGGDTDQLDPEPPSAPKASSVTHWNIVPEVIIIDFLRAALPDLNQTWTFGTNVRAHDFALFELGRDPFQKLNNSYEYKSVKHMVTTQYMEYHPDPLCLEIIVLLGHNTFARGKMLPGISHIWLAGVEFTTIRLLLDESLAPGTSGSWVVSGSSLQGIVIASYNQEPIAHMIPAQRLFRDIMSAFPPLLSVSLPPVTGRVKEKHDGSKIKLELSVSDSNAPQTLSISSSTMIIWGLPQNFSESDLKKLWNEGYNWDSAILLPALSPRGDFTSCFVVLKFRDKIKAQAARWGFHRKYSQVGVPVGIIEDDDILAHYSLEDLVISVRENGLSPAASLLRSARDSISNSALARYRRSMAIRAGTSGGFESLCDTLNIANLPINTSEEELRPMITRQEGYKRMYFRTEQNGPICLVQFQDASFATRALFQLYGRSLRKGVNGGIRVYYTDRQLVEDSSGILSVQTNSTFRNSENADVSWNVKVANLF